MAQKLSDEARKAALAKLERWTEVAGRNAISRKFTFRDFNEAFGFMARVALVAEKRDHHPDWSNSWNAVVIDVVNHSAGGVTEACIELCIAIEAISREMLQRDEPPA
jgi:4a-hydroxytetrahydrobiopterin dehydratase